ncbi:MAG: RDD family protein [Chloroflexota bacterium]|nr:RDD family protein [Chloroflexota bacterium]
MSTIPPQQPPGGPPSYQPPPPYQPPPYQPPYQGQPPGGVPPYSTPPPYMQPGAPGYQWQGAVATPQYANYFVRFVAVFIDGLIIGIPLLVIAAILGFVGSPVSALLNGIVYFLYEGLLLASWNGQTIGKKVMSVRVVSADGTPLTTNKTFTRAGVKAILSIASSIKPPLTSFLGIAALLDYLWPLWDANKQTWHDKAAGTYVVKA